MARKSSGDIIHFGAVRLRATGSGDLCLYLRSLDDVNFVQLVDLPLSATTNREPTVLANFSEQKAQLELRTTEIDTTFVVSRIVVFTKPLFTSFPQ